MRKILLLFAAWILMSMVLQAQPEKGDKYLGLAFQPQYAVNFYGVKNDTTRGAYLDSLKELQKGRFAYSAGIVYSRSLKNRDWIIQTGVMFSETGFKRVFDSLYQGLVLHPDVPKIEDLAQGSPRSVEFNYRFRYIDVPVIFSHRIRDERIDRDWQFFLTVGLTFQALISHDQKVYFRGFSVDDEDRFVSQNTGFEARPFNIVANLGARFDYRIYAGSVLSIQPLINAPLLSATTGNDIVRFLNPGVQFTFYKDLNYRKELREP